MVMMLHDISSRRKMSKVINLFGGPGAGKSTLAAAVYYKLKMRGLKAELVREYVKDWAWSNRKIGQYDQIYITGKQANKETQLYGKVDYIVTDSPLLISPFYQQYYSDVDIVGPAVFALLRYAKGNGVEYYNFFVRRNKEYMNEGRYETKEQAIAIDEAMKKFLDRNGVDSIYLDMKDEEKADAIISYLGI